MKAKLVLAALCSLTDGAFAATPTDGSVLPFPPAPSASKAGPTLQESVHKRRVEPDRLPKDAPTIDLECGAEASGVLYALGGSGGGLTCYVDKGHLVFEYNLMIIDRSLAKSAEKIAPGKHTLVVETKLKAPKPGAPADIVLTVDGQEVARTTVKMTVPAAFTASESFDVGTDLGSTVSRDYFERRPFKFDGKIEQVKVELK